MNEPSAGLTRRRSLVLLGVIMAVAAGLRIHLFNGYTGLDDAEYGRLAYLMARGEFPLHDYPGPAAFLVRVGLTAPTALLVSLVGLSERSMAVVPFLASILCLPLAYAFAGMLFGRPAGLVAAAILAVVPSDIESATTLVPDLPAAVLAAAGVVLIVYLSRADGVERGRAFAGGLAAGLLFGASWLMKEAIAYLAPFILVLLALTLRSRGRAFLVVWVGAAMGAVGTVAAEMIVYHALTGDALFRFHEVERNYAALDNGFFSEGSAWGWEAGESRSIAIVRRLFITGPRALLWNAGTSYLPLVGLLGAAWAWFRRDRAFLIPSLWLVILLLMYNFASSSTAAYTPLALFNRYLFPLYFPSVVLAGALIGRQLAPAASAVRRHRFPLRQWTGLLATGILLVAAVRPLIWSIREPEKQWWTAEVRELARTLGPDTRLYSDTLSLRGLDFFERYPGENRWIDFQRVRSAGEIAPGSLVLITPHYLDWLDRNRGMWLSSKEDYRLHPFFETPPPEWSKVWENGRSTLFRVGPPPA